MARSVRIVSSESTSAVTQLPAPDFEAAHLRDAELASELLEEGRALDAIEVVRAGLSVRPRSPELLLLLGRGLVVQGELAQARRVLMEGAMLAPANIELSVWLAQVLLHLGEGDRAVRVLQRVIGVAGIDDRLAELYARACLAAEEKRQRGLAPRTMTAEPDNKPEAGL